MSFEKKQKKTFLLSLRFRDTSERERERKREKERKLYLIVLDKEVLLSSLKRLFNPLV